MESAKKQQTTIKLGYWNIRGLQHHVQALLQYLNLDYDLELYNVGPAPEYSREEWFSVKHTLGYDFPNLPYLQDGEDKITDTKAIMLYLANKYNKELLGKSDKDFGLVNMLLFKLHDDTKWPLTMQCYTSEDKDKLCKDTLDKLKSISEYLGEKTYLLGDYLTLVDLYALELLDFAETFTNGKVFEQYQNLKQYQQKLYSLEKLQSWKKSDKYITSPYNNTMAKINA